MKKLLLACLILMGCSSWEESRKAVVLKIDMTRSASYYVAGVTTLKDLDSGFRFELPGNRANVGDTITVAYHNGDGCTGNEYKWEGSMKFKKGS